MKKQLTIALTSVFLFSSALAFAKVTESQTPTKLTFNVINESGVDVYYAPYSIVPFTGPNWHANDYVKCATLEGQDQFPLADGKQATLTFNVEDPSCFDFLTTFAVSAQKPVADVDNVPNPNPVDIAQCIVTILYNAEQNTLSQQLWCDNMSTHSLLTSANWGPAAGHDTTLELKSLKP